MEGGRLRGREKGSRQRHAGREGGQAGRVVCGGAAEGRRRHTHEVRHQRRPHGCHQQVVARYAGGGGQQGGKRRRGVRHPCQQRSQRAVHATEAAAHAVVQRSCAQLGGQQWRRDGSHHLLLRATLRMQLRQHYRQAAKGAGRRKARVCGGRRG